MREHYQPWPVRRASWANVAVDVLQALTIAALIGAPFALYFWNMKP
jgi:hypothetical protein